MPIHQHLLQILQPQIHNMRQLALAQRMEDHDVIHAIQKLRPEMLAQLIHHAHLRISEAVLALGPRRRQLARSKIRCHDQHRVLEVHRPSLRVRQPPIIQYLQQHIEHIRMRLLDFVEQHHRVRPPSHRLRQLPALVEPDISRRRANQPRHRMPLHVLAHIDAHHRLFIIEQELRQRLRRLRFPHARRPEKDKRTNRPFRIAQPRARTPNRIGHSLQRLILPHHALPQTTLHLRQLRHLALQHLRHRNPRPLRHNPSNIFLIHLFL